MEIAVVVVTVVLVVAVVAVLARQGSPGRLSEEDGHPRPSHVDDRPAGPDAEAMRPEPPGQSDPGPPRPPEEPR